MMCRDNQITLKDLERMTADEYYATLEVYLWYTNEMTDNG